LSDFLKQNADSGGHVALTFETARRLFNAGRYADIVADAADRELSALSVEYRVFLAQAMFQAGQIRRAREIVERERERASGVARYRCEFVFGLLCRHDAQFGRAIQHFNTAFQLAREHNDHLEVAWTSLHRFRLLAQLHPSDELAPMLIEVRRHVAKAGDPHATAYMHNAVALMEVASGRSEEARRHLEISRSLISSFPNAALEQLDCILRSGVDFLECKFQSAIDNLAAARRLASITGSRELSGIECNHGHAMLVTGRLRAAEACFLRVVENDSGLSRFGALEGLARVYLATGELNRCSETLDAHDAFLLRDKNLSSALSGRWTPSTRVRLLLKQGCFHEAAQTAKSSLEAAERLKDRFVVNDLTYLLAESLSNCGQSTAAARALLSLTARDTEPPGNIDATFYRAMASIWRPTSPSLANELIKRARHIYAYHGNKYDQAELEFTDQTTAGHVVEHAQVPHLILSGIASLLGNADAPRLVARELIQLSDRLQCTPRTEVIESVDSIADPFLGNRIALFLGTEESKHTYLIFDVPREAHQVAVLTELLKIGGAAVAIQRSRRERRKKAALWPAEAIDEAAGGLFVSEEMQTLLATARRVATTNVPVLITGETGTGKEVLARAIHAFSNRAKAAFLPFNCTSTPRDMLDSQLFGHRRGSFTGAIDNFQGIIRGAANGTLFLDEIGDMSLEVQPKLLRFLESNEVHPIGETQPVRVDVRVIAATNANLDTLVSEGRFREDLFYRLNIVHLPIPPLRERRIEIPALANHYLEKYALEYGKGNLRLAEETMEYLVLYRWPGNVRQLANEMRRMAALCEAGAVVMPEHLSTPIAASRRTVPASERILDPTEVVVRLDQPMAAATEHLERALLQYALKQCGGRMEETAAMLGLSRKGLYLKRQRFGIEPPESATVSV
jgi:DNA-binding NtrC family response regulator/tetratricopeptide (TPR) repeat protein